MAQDPPLLLVLGATTSELAALRAFAPRVTPALVVQGTVSQPWDHLLSFDEALAAGAGVIPVFIRSQADVADIDRWLDRWSPGIVGFVSWFDDRGVNVGVERVRARGAQVLFIGAATYDDDSLAVWTEIVGQSLEVADLVALSLNGGHSDAWSILNEDRPENQEHEIRYADLHEAFPAPRVLLSISELPRLDLVAGFVGTFWQLDQSSEDGADRVDFGFAHAITVAQLRRYLEQETETR